jgi:GxxExxY protein
MDTDAHGSDMSLTEGVIGSAFEVANVLGSGFLEKLYERALIRELALRGLSAKAQVSFPVCYKGQYIGEYVADLVVEEKLIVELEVCGALRRSTPGAMHQLPESVPPSRGSADQLPETKGRVEAHSLGPVAPGPEAGASPYGGIGD